MEILVLEIKTHNLRDPYWQAIKPTNAVSCRKKNQYIRSRVAVWNGSCSHILRCLAYRNTHFSVSNKHLSISSTFYKKKRRLQQAQTYTTSWRNPHNCKSVAFIVGIKTVSVLSTWKMELNSTYQLITNDQPDHTSHIRINIRTCFYSFILSQFTSESIGENGEVCNLYNIAEKSNQTKHHRIGWETSPRHRHRPPPPLRHRY